MVSGSVEVPKPSSEAIGDGRDELGTMNSKTSQQAGSVPDRWEVVGWPDGSLGARKWVSQSTTSSKAANGATQMLVQNLRPAIVVTGEQRAWF